MLALKPDIQRSQHDSCPVVEDHFTDYPMCNATSCPARRLASYLRGTDVEMAETGRAKDASGKEPDAPTAAKKHQTTLSKRDVGGICAELMSIPINLTWKGLDECLDFGPHIGPGVFDTGTASEESMYQGRREWIAQREEEQQTLGKYSTGSEADILWHTHIIDEHGTIHSKGDYFWRDWEAKIGGVLADETADAAASASIWRAPYSSSLKHRGRHSTARWFGLPSLLPSPGTGKTSVCLTLGTLMQLQEVAVNVSILKGLHSPIVCGGDFGDAADDEAKTPAATELATPRFMVVSTSNVQADQSACDHADVGLEAGDIGRMCPVKRELKVFENNEKPDFRNLDEPVDLHDCMQTERTLEQITRD
ncbi:uncharacterized protein B0I36DRAFT_358115 [Microdochium trichocladiopsis]|uniref:Uncharacterized protein n=1 Tax=Microdochium trichocladiopsis TaxID=1682393 RepID=A0A9P8YFN0_9PEZI|nr:uncharacterized protein B0I36DRAFT_358115 [Microdochium trichocladiopsis]KAH7040877.1 hypothetical protein B0I36DRAFT_358115 [Microdochium trichocladiopsis]